MEAQTTEFGIDFPTVERMEGFIAHCKSCIASRNESENQRMENYYNCVDDYSWGGLCTQASNQAISRYNGMIDRMQKQIESGKPLVWEIEDDVLCTSDGTLIPSAKKIHTRFGTCWLIPGDTPEDRPTFVNCAKKQATYLKKGFMAKIRKDTVEIYFLPKETQNENKYGSMAYRDRIIASELIEWKY